MTVPALPRGRYNRQQANFGTCYVVARAYSLVQLNTRRAHAGLCRASSTKLYCLLTETQGVNNLYRVNTQLCVTDGSTQSVLGRIRLQIPDLDSHRISHFFTESETRF